MYLGGSTYQLTAVPLEEFPVFFKNGTSTSVFLYSYLSFSILSSTILPTLHSLPLLPLFPFSLLRSHLSHLSHSFSHLSLLPSSLSLLPSSLSLLSSSLKLLSSSLSLLPSSLSLLPSSLSHSFCYLSSKGTFLPLRVTSGTPLLGEAGLAGTLCWVLHSPSMSSSQTHHTSHIRQYHGPGIVATYWYVKPCSD